jgi:peptide/nickel transport system substrate-binding protein
MIPVRSTIPNYLPLFLALILVSCGGSQMREGEDTAKSEKFDQELKYIKLDDAAQALPSWSDQNIVIYHTIAEPDNLHPTNGTSAMRNEIFQYIHRTLVHLDYRTLEITNGLLRNVPVLNDDGTEYICELRDEIRWDDGSPVTAKDVIFTAKANKCFFTDNPHAKPYWENLEDVIADPGDPLKFTVKMRSAYMHNLVFWGDWPVLQQSYYDPQGALDQFLITEIDHEPLDESSRKMLKSWADGFNAASTGREPASISGAGQYKVAAWDPGISVTLERKKGHWTEGSSVIYETSYPDQIIYRINKDPNSQILDFKAQVFDGSNYLSTKTLLELQTDSGFNANYHSRFTDSFNYTYIAMNMRPESSGRTLIFNDRDVRMAMSLLTPVDELNHVINRSMNKRMIGPVSFLKSDFDTTLSPIPYDPVQAADLLDKAGWKDTDGDNIRDKVINGKKTDLEFSLNYMTNTPDWKDYAAICKEHYEQAGMLVNLNPLDFSILVADARNHDFDMMIGVWGQSAYPEDFTQLWHSGSWVSNGTNYPGFGNEETDALIDSIKVIVDPDKRAPLVKRFQRIVYEEQPMIFLFSSLRKNVIHRRFGNAEMYFERPGILLNNLKLIKSESEPNS